MWPPHAFWWTCVSVAVADSVIVVVGDDVAVEAVFVDYDGVVFVVDEYDVAAVDSNVAIFDVAKVAVVADSVIADDDVSEIVVEYSVVDDDDDYDIAKVDVANSNVAVFMLLN